MTSGFVQTVLGPVPPDCLGLTHTHEHLLIDMRCYHWLPEEASRREWVDAALTIDRLGFVARNQNACLDEITLLDERAAISELSSFRLAGARPLWIRPASGLPGIPWPWREYREPRVWRS